MNLSRCKRCGYHYAPEKLESDTLDRHFGMCLDRAACSRRVKQREDDRKAMRASRPRPDFDPRIDYPERYA